MAGKDIWSGQEDIPCMVKKGVKKKKRLNRSLLKQFKTSLGPEQERLITQKDTEIEELQKSIQEDRDCRG